LQRHAQFFLGVDDDLCSLETAAQTSIVAGEWWRPSRRPASCLRASYGRITPNSHK
jgi:hypothetical protein